MRNISTRSFSLSLALSLPLFAVACGDDHDHTHDPLPDAAPDVDAPPAPVAVALKFAAEVGGTPFACGQTYTDIGSTSASYVTTDFRYYVHNVRLVGADGDVPVTLEVNDWQTADGIAMLDFEDNTGTCQMGTIGTHTELTGTVPAGTYTGIKFDVGVPFEKNHLEPTSQPAPLNAPGMYWTWRGGYKFLKTDGAVDGKGFNLHLGSTGCTSPDPLQPPTAPCVNPNVMSISLTGFDPATSVVVADVASVLADVDVTTNTAQTSPGCMSFPGDPECAAIFPHLGLAYDANPAGTQAMFSVR